MNKLKSKKEQFAKNESLRQSSPDIQINDQFKSKYIETEKISVLEKINDNLKTNKSFRYISSKIKIEPIYILLILLIPIIILLLTFFTFTTKMITILYPLYKSFKTLQYQINKTKIDGKLYKKEDEDRNTTQWLSYWLLYAFVSNSECILGSFLEKRPLYKFLKFVFLLLCFLPQVQLSVLIYTYFTSKLYQLYGESFEKSIVNFMRNIFSKKNENNEDEIREEDNPYRNGDSRDLIDDDFVKRKKNE